MSRKRPLEGFYQHSAIISLVASGTMISSACAQCGVVRSVFYWRINHDAKLMEEFKAAREQGKKAQGRYRRSKKLRDERRALRDSTPLFSEEKKAQVLERVRSGSHIIDAGLSVKIPEPLLRQWCVQGQERINAGDLESEKAQFVLSLQEASSLMRSQASEKILASDPLQFMLNAPQGRTPGEKPWAKSNKFDIESKREVRIITEWAKEPRTAHTFIDSALAVQQLPPLPQNWQNENDDDDD